MITVESTDGVRLALHRLGRGSGVPILFAHATGFCASVWEPVARRLPGVESWALDFRSHGASGRPADGDMDWSGVGRDVLAAVDAVGLRGALGVGHSMGGAALLLAEVARPSTFAGLWLYEPIVIAGAPFPDAEGSPLAEGALRRRSWFPSLDAARANYAGKPPFDALHPEALDAYLRGGFEAAADGSVHLRCRPEDEAACYRMGGRHEAGRRLAEVRCDVTVLRGRVHPGPPELAAFVARGLPSGRLVERPDLGHFGPLEDPDSIAESIRHDLDRLDPTA